MVMRDSQPAFRKAMKSCICHGRKMSNHPATILIGRSNSPMEGRKFIGAHHESAAELCFIQSCQNSTCSPTTFWTMLATGSVSHCRRRILPMPSRCDIIKRNIRSPGCRIRTR